MWLGIQLLYGRVQLFLCYEVEKCRKGWKKTSNFLINRLFYLFHLKVEDNLSYFSKYADHSQNIPRLLNVTALLVDTLIDSDKFNFEVR